MKRLFLAFLLLNIMVGVTAQTFTGRVVGVDGKPVKAVSVSLLGGENKKAVSFTQSDEDGYFKVVMPENKDVRFISFRSIGYSFVEIPIGEFKAGQIVTMTEESLNLKEVKVTAKRIKQYGDTLIFSVDGFKQQQDRTIADVIKKMPGLDVQSDGKITYQGKAINEFTVEGMDLTNGKYAQISENLAADKVKSVEVRENNQPKKVLKDVQFSEQAALNLVLKDDAKNVWQEIVDVSTGSSLQGEAEWLHDTRLMGMVFSKKHQSVSMWKTNNTGKDIQMEVGDLIFESNALSPVQSRLSGISGSTANVDDKRFTFNDSELAATNWLFKTKGGNDLRLQASWFFDKSCMNSYGETIYNDIAGGWAMKENASVRQYSSKWNAELQYKVNNDNMYLNNKMKASMDFDRASGVATLNGSDTREFVKPRSRFISDAVEIIRKMNNGNSYTVSSAMAYDYLPGQMLLCDNSMEKLDMAAFRWNTQANFRQKLRQFSVSWNVGSQVTLNQMDVCNLMEKKDDVRYNEERIFVYPGLSFDNKRLRINANPRISWLRREFESQKRNDILFEPTLFISYKQGPSLDYGANYLLNSITDGLEEICDVPVFTSYRTMRVENCDFSKSQTHNISAYVRYHHIMKGLFANANVSYHSTRHTKLYSSDVAGNFYRQFASGRYDNTEGWGVSGDVSKTFSWAKTIVKAGGSWGCNDYHILMSETLVPYRTENFTVNLGFSMKPLHLISIEEKSRFVRSTQKNKLVDGGVNSALNHFEHELKVFVLPGKWQVEIDYEIYHSNDHSVTFCHFADVAVSYRTKRYEVGLWINNVMGMDKYERRYVTSTQNVYSITRLRPREMMARVFFNL